MDSSKPWWASKTIWTNVVMVVATFAGVAKLGIDLSADTQVLVVSAIMGIANVVLRLVTHQPIASNNQ